MVPKRLPWSVRASAVIPSSPARSVSRSIRHAPSSRLYSEWTWRWTKFLGVDGTRGLTKISVREAQAGRSATAPGPSLLTVDVGAQAWPINRLFPRASSAAHVHRNQDPQERAH